MSWSPATASASGPGDLLQNPNIHEVQLHIRMRTAVGGPTRYDAASCRPPALPLGSVRPRRARPACLRPVARSTQACRDRPGLPSCAKSGLKLLSGEVRCRWSWREPTATTYERGGECTDRAPAATIYGWPMPIKRRRSLALVLVVLVAAVTGGAAGLAALAGDTERIDGYWVGAELTESGLRVTEVIDYDFGPRNRRGIFRDVPDLIPSSVSVWSPTAPRVTEVTERSFSTRIRIGNPRITISGRHRYRIDASNRHRCNKTVSSASTIGTGWGSPSMMSRSRAIRRVDLPECSRAVGRTTMHHHRPRRWPLPAEVRQVPPGDGVTVSGRLGDTTGNVERLRHHRVSPTTLGRLPLRPPSPSSPHS